MVLLKLKNSTVQIDAGELVSYQANDHEYIHQKGNPGWRNADTEMFPIIGPTNEANFRVGTPRGKAIQDQHGLLREMEYVLTLQTETKAVFEKNYKANTKIKNSKFPNKSTETLLSWPYDFQFKKSLELREDGLNVVFEISGEAGMPFMLGYHPAFNLNGKNPVLKTDTKEISLLEVLAVGSRALQVPNCEKIVLEDEKLLEISTEGFGNFMLWTEVPSMVCIEPITFYPYAVKQENLQEGFLKVGSDSSIFEVVIKPL